MRLFRRKPPPTALPVRRSMVQRILSGEFGDAVREELVELILPTDCLHRNGGMRCDKPFDHDMPWAEGEPLITHTARRSSFGEDYTYNWVKP